MRLIDADKFRSFLDRQYHSCHGYSGNKKELYREALRTVKSYVHSEGQIDAVPVVRCKDCTYSYEEFGFIYCTFGPYGDCVVQPEFYCADGKRKRYARGVE